MKEGISIVSSFAEDTLIRPSGEIISRQKGGPIIFIEQALRKSNVPYNLHSGETINVEILMTDDGEFGRVPHRPQSLMFPTNDIRNYAIVSTLLQEWNLPSIQNYQGKLFVDVQGYVREGSDFGKKRVWEEAMTFADAIYCMKGTKEEIMYLPPSIRDKQKERLLIATDGEKGLDMFYQGQFISLPAQKIDKPRDTIGAGDTFYGYFVASMYKGEPPLTAAGTAIKHVANFLSSK